MDDTLRLVYRAYDQLCAERLTPNLRAYAEKLAAHGHLQPAPEVLAQLEHLSASTVRRRLAVLTQDEPRRPRSQPPVTGLPARIPAGHIPGDIAYPGHFETDLVHHSAWNAARPPDHRGVRLHPAPARRAHRVE